MATSNCELSDGFCLPKGTRTVTISGQPGKEYERVSTCNQNQFENGDHAGVIDGMTDYRKAYPEGHFGHYLMMAAAIGGRACTAPGERFSEYEASVGTGQVHVWFERPAGGWAA